MRSRIFLVLLLAPGLAGGQTRERGRFSLQGDDATAMALDAQGQNTLIAFHSGNICVFPADQRVVHVYSHNIHKKPITAAAFLADGKEFATVSTDGSLKVWDVAAARAHHKEMEAKTGEAKPPIPKPVRSVTAHPGAKVTCLAIRPDGKQLATGGSDGAVRLWDAADLKSLATLKDAHPGGVHAVTFAPDGQTLATGGTDKTARLWKAGEKPDELHKLDHPGAVNAVAFSPDGKQLATGTGVAKESGLVQVWEVNTGKPAYKLEGHEDVVTCVVFHPKTNHLASGGADKKIRVWDLAEKKTLYVDEHAEPLRGLIISADGVRFGSCSARAVRWWAGFGKQ
jgi:WD40 repeat protein